MTDKERDDALIAEAERLATKATQSTTKSLAWIEECQSALIHLVRSNWQPASKPDRAEVLAGEVISAANIVSHDGYYELDEEAVTTIIRRHIDGLRAEWEAERPAVVVPEDDWSKGKEDCDGNELVTFRKDDLVKQMTNRFLGWRLPEDFRPDAGISFEPEFNKEWNASQGKPPQRHTPTGTNLFNATQAEAMVRYILDGAKGGE